MFADTVVQHVYTVVVFIILCPWLYQGTGNTYTLGPAGGHAMVAIETKGVVVSVTYVLLRNIKCNQTCQMSLRVASDVVTLDCLLSNLPPTSRARIYNTRVNLT